jgi:hypothetical protein
LELCRWTRGYCLQETVGYTTDNDDAAEPDVDRGYLRGLLGLFVDAVMYYAKYELDEHSCYDKETKDLMARVKFLALNRMLAQCARNLLGN